MVVGVLASLAGLVKARVSKTQVDNTVFRLHYRWTTSFCFLCSALLAATEFIGDPIHCHGAEKPETTYCWISSTYTINATSTPEMNFYDSHGSGKSHIGNYIPELHKKTVQNYYQWVPFVLFIQGCFFYLPHQIWKLIEGKQLENLLQGLNTFSTVDDSFEKKKENLINYMRRSFGRNKKYWFGYFFAEVLNFVNVVAQMFIIDAFFGGMFLHLGTNIFLLPLKDDAGRWDPLIEVFPRQAKCDFYTTGPSGSLQKHDFLCILPQNLLNEKIFLVMWIWFVILMTATSAQLLFRVAMFSSPAIRLKLLEQRGKLTNSQELEPLVHYLPLGDFFLLHTIGKNLEAVCFQRIVQGLLKDATNDSADAAENQFTGFNNLVSESEDANEDTIDLRLRRKMMEDTNV